MIKKYSELKEYIIADLNALGVKTNLYSIFKEPSAKYTVILRIYEFLLNTNKNKILLYSAKFYYRRLSHKLGFSIGPNVFKKGVAIVHHGLLIIDPTTRIDENCRIHMGVHIGGSAKFVPPEDQSLYSPRIGKNVYIGPGAKIYGPVEIGDDCTIGANAVVTKSFPDNGLTIAGVPAKVIHKNDGLNSRILKIQIEE